MEWDWVTEDAVNLPDSKSGPRTIWLGSAARELLQTRERLGRYVFSNNGAPVLDYRISLVWANVRTRLNKPTLRIHDLRHSFSSIAVGTGEDLGTIGGLLGHADKVTTAGYAHLAEAPVMAAAARVGEMIAAKTRAKRPWRNPVQRKPAQRKTAQLRTAGPQTDPSPPVPEEHWEDVRAFMRAGKSIKRWCAAKDIDPDTLRSRIVLWRSTNGRLS